MRAQMPIARQVLQKLLKDRLMFTPEKRGRQRGYRFSGEGSIMPLLTGMVPELSRAVASLMPASWNQIVPWLRLLDGLRQAA
jgi:hypothetical protein